MRSLVECLELLTVSKHINVVVGDFDLPKINWATFSCPDNFIHKPFLDFTVDNGFSQFVQFVTNNKNRPILDLVLSDYYDRYICHLAEKPFGNSDQCCIFVLPTQINIQVLVSTNVCSPHMVINTMIGTELITTTLNTAYSL